MSLSENNRNYNTHKETKVKQEIDEEDDVKTPQSLFPFDIKEEIKVEKVTFDSNQLSPLSPADSEKSLKLYDQSPKENMPSTSGSGTVKRKTNEDSDLNLSKTQKMDFSNNSRPTALGYTGTHEHDHCESTRRESDWLRYPIFTILNLPTEWTKEQVEQFVESECGADVEVKLMVDQGFNFIGSARVIFPNFRQCLENVKKFKDKEVEGKKLEVEFLSCNTPFEGEQNQESTDKRIRGDESTKNRMKMETGKEFDVWDYDPSGFYGLKSSYLKSLDIEPPLDKWVHVTNFRCDKSELREVMELAGHVLYCGVFTFRNKYAKVMYTHPLEAVQAVSMLNGQRFYGQCLKVTIDRYGDDTVVLPKGIYNVGPGLGISGKPVRDIVRQYERYLKGKKSSINTIAFRHLDDLLFSFEESSSINSQYVSLATTMSDEDFKRSAAEVLKEMKRQGVCPDDLMKALRMVASQNEGKTFHLKSVETLPNYMTETENSDRKLVLATSTPNNSTQQLPVQPQNSSNYNYPTQSAPVNPNLNVYSNLVESNVTHHPSPNQSFNQHDSVQRFVGPRQDFHSNTLQRTGPQSFQHQSNTTFSQGPIGPSPTPYAATPTGPSACHRWVQSGSSDSFGPSGPRPEAPASSTYPSSGSMSGPTGTGSNYIGPIGPVSGLTGPGGHVAPLSNSAGMSGTIHPMSGNVSFCSNQMVSMSGSNVPLPGPNSGPINHMPGSTVPPSGSTRPMFGAITGPTNPAGSMPGSSGVPRPTVSNMGPRPPSVVPSVSSGFGSTSNINDPNSLARSSQIRPVNDNIVPGAISPGAATIKMSNLPQSVTFPMLSDKLSNCGQILSLQFAKPGTAVVQFAHRNQAEKCYQQFNNSFVDGKVVFVTFV